MLTKVVNTTCNVLNNIVGMTVYNKIKQEERPMRKNYYSNEDSIRVMAELIAKHFDEVSDADYEDMVAALDYKCSTARLERLVDRIISKSREVSMDEFYNCSDEKHAFKELFEEVFYLVNLDGKRRRNIRKERSISVGRNNRKPWLNNERDEDDEYENYGRKSRNRNNDQTGLETFARYVDEYMRRNNIPFPATETAFVGTFNRIKKTSNDPDIIAYKGGAKKLFAVMQREYR